MSNTTTDWLTLAPDEQEQIRRQLERDVIAELAQVIRGQREEAGLPDNGWWDAWCIETDSHCDVFQGSVEDFAAKLFKDDWYVVDLKQNQVMCPACRDDTGPELTERELWLDEKVYAAHKGEQG